jgi:hypothetical protein
MYSRIATEKCDAMMCAYREADDDASSEDEGPSPAYLRGAPVAVVAHDGLHLPTRNQFPHVNPQPASEKEELGRKMTERTTNPAIGPQIHVRDT